MTGIFHHWDHLSKLACQKNIQKLKTNQEKKEKKKGDILSKYQVDML